MLQGLLHLAHEGHEGPHPDENAWLLWLLIPAGALLVAGAWIAFTAIRARAVMPELKPKRRRTLEAEVARRLRIAGGLGGAALLVAAAIVFLVIRAPEEEGLPVTGAVATSTPAPDDPFPLEFVEVRPNGFVHARAINNTDENAFVQCSLDLRGEDGARLQRGTWDAYDQDLERHVSPLYTTRVVVLAEGHQEFSVDMDVADPVDSIEGSCEQLPMPDEIREQLEAGQ